MKKIPFAIASLLTIILLSKPVRAAEDAVPQPIVVVATVLQLSEAQVQTLIHAIQAREEAIRPIGEALHKDHEALEALLATSAPDPAAVGRLILDIRGRERQVSDLAKSAAASFAESLTSEQRQRLQAIAQAAEVAPVVPAFKAVGLM